MLCFSWRFMLIFLGKHLPSRFPSPRFSYPKLSNNSSRTSQSSHRKLVWTPVLRGICLSDVIIFSSFSVFISAQTFPLPSWRYLSENRKWTAPYFFHTQDSVSCEEKKKNSPWTTSHQSSHQVPLLLPIQSLPTHLPTKYRPPGLLSFMKSTVNTLIRSNRNIRGPIPAEVPVGGPSLFYPHHLPSGIPLESQSHKFQVSLLESSLSSVPRRQYILSISTYLELRPSRCPVSFD